MKGIGSFFVFACLAWADLLSVRAEPNLEKRSDLALEFASQSMDSAKKAYEETPAEFAGRLADIQAGAELSYTSLQETGKAARRSPKYFKRAELKLRALLRRLDNLAKEVSIEDRKPVDGVHARVSELHEQVLHEIMSKSR